MLTLLALYGAATVLGAILWLWFRRGAAKPESLEEWMDRQW